MRPQTSPGAGGSGLAAVAGAGEVRRVEGDHREQLVGHAAALQAAVRVGDVALDAAGVAAGALDQLQGARVDEQRPSSMSLIGRMATTVAGPV